MPRKTYEELQNIMRAEGCDRIWSWSKFNCAHNSLYEYFLKYVCKPRVEPDRQDSIYVATGGIAHDILEKFYTGKIKYEDMINEFEDGWTMAFNVADLKFDRSDEERNQKISEKYYADLQHFFKYHNIITHKIMIEQFVKAKFGNNLFHGYIDRCHKDEEGNYYILDWKTSSIYTGQKAENEFGQLFTYATALNQAGIPFDKIKAGWNFLKYVTVKYHQANGEVKSRNIERFEIGEKLKSNAKMWLKKSGYENDIDYYLDLLVKSNDIKSLPKEISSKYEISDCIVIVPITEKIIDYWTNHIINTITDIESREKDYAENGNDKVFWDTEESIKAQSYYFANLCGYSPKLHLPYKKYLEDKEAKENEKNNMFSGVGLDDIEEVKETKEYTGDLSWLNDI